MSTEAKKQYYDATENSQVRSDLSDAVGLLGGNKIAIDCGCGAGADIQFLRVNGFTVHAFDIEEEAITRCKKRFKGDVKVILSQDGFSSFSYPSASLILADASLFFCPQVEFGSVWNSIRKSLVPNGIFCGSFLGPNDTMAGPDYDKAAFWPEVIYFTADEVRKHFIGFDVVKWTEHEMSGKTP